MQDIQQSKIKVGNKYGPQRGGLLSSWAAFCHPEQPFVILSVSEGSGDGSRRRAPEWYSRSFTPPTASFRMTVLFRLKMTVSFQLRMTYGPRTRKFRIVLYLKELQKVDVRGPLPVQGANPSETTILNTHITDIFRRTGGREGVEEACPPAPSTILINKRRG